MYKFSYQAPAEQKQVFYFNSFNNLVKYLFLLCEARTIKEVIQCQKKYNLQFFISKF